MITQYSREKFSINWDMGCKLRRTSVGSIGITAVFLQYQKIISTALSTDEASPLSSKQVNLVKNLETSLKKFAFPPFVNTNATINFGEFLYPNEAGVKGVASHLEKGFADGDGILVSTGTERSFFDLAQCDPENCKGLVIIDINPRVKAYVDFLICLLRISSDLKEFKQLFDRIKGEDLNTKKERIDLIENKLKESDLPEFVKKYYLDNLNSFASIYFKNNFWIFESHFDAENQYIPYWKEDKFFQILQGYAKSGNIIAKIGCISELLFLDEYNIRTIDCSNISDYNLLKFKINQKSNPLIIFTKPDPISDTTYKSEFPDTLTSKETEDLETLIPYIGYISQNRSRCSFLVRADYFPGYNQKTLAGLNSYVKEFVIRFSQNQWINFETHTVHGLDAQTIQKFCTGNKEMKKFLDRMILLQGMLNCNSYGTHPPDWPDDVYEAFSETPGWIDAFDAHCKSHPFLLKKLTTKFKSPSIKGLSTNNVYTAIKRLNQQNLGETGKGRNGEMQSPALVGQSSD